MLAIDLGNSTVQFGLFSERHDGAHPVERWSIDTSSLLHHGLVLSDHLDLDGERVVRIASVVPHACELLLRELDRLLPRAEKHVVQHRDVPLKNLYREPLHVGIDRLLSSFAAFRLWGGDGHHGIIVVDLGTATTFNCITARGEYVGGAITLGIAASMRALAERGAQLPQIPLAFPPSVIGHSTIENIQSGILFGGISMIEGMLQRMKRELFNRTPCAIVATGGLADLLQHQDHPFDHVDKDLVLKGIALLGSV